MLAKKVETHAEFVAAQKAGFDYFQGYFFRKPELRTTGPMPANRIGYLRLLQAASNPDFDASAIEKAVKSDASFCYRLLRYLNSASFGFSNEIHSVRHAISMLGESEFRRWVRMVTALGASDGKCSDVLLAGLVRARFCELMAPAVQSGGSDFFFLGLLSVMDSVLEMPMARVLETVPVAQEIKAALLGEASTLRPLYLLMLALESGDWQEVKKLAQQFRLSDARSGRLLLGSYGVGAPDYRGKPSLNWPDESASGDTPEAPDIFQVGVSILIYWRFLDCGNRRSTKPARDFDPLDHLADVAEFPKRQRPDPVAVSTSALEIERPAHVRADTRA